MMAVEFIDKSGWVGVGGGSEPMRGAIYLTNFSPSYICNCLYVDI